MINEHSNDTFILNATFFLSHELIPFKEHCLEITQVCVDLPCLITATNYEGKHIYSFCY